MCASSEIKNLYYLTNHSSASVCHITTNQWSNGRGGYRKSYAGFGRSGSCADGRFAPIFVQLLRHGGVPVRAHRQAGNDPQGRFGGAC